MRTLQTQIVWGRRAQWALGGFMLSTVVAFYAFGYRPLTNRQRALEADTRAKLRELDANQARARARTEIAAKNERLRVELDRIKKPSRWDELPQVIKDLTLAGQQSALRKFNYDVRSVPSRNGGLFCEQPLSVTFEGDFVNVFQFLRTTEDMQRLTRVRSLNLKVKDAKSGQVQAQMALNLYFSLD